LAAATICIALVIFRVAFTEAMRFLKSLSEGIAYPLRKALGEGLNRCLE
jgi:hypothetical protein